MNQAIINRAVHELVQRGMDPVKAAERVTHGRARSIIKQIKREDVAARLRKTGAIVWVATHK